MIARQHYTLFIFLISTFAIHASLVKTAQEASLIEAGKGTKERTSFLFRTYGLDEKSKQFKALLNSKDLQREIVRKLKSPFKPIVPKPVKEITHPNFKPKHKNYYPEEEDIQSIMISNSGTHIFVSRGTNFFIQSLDDQEEASEVLSNHPHSLHARAFTQDDSKVIVTNYETIEILDLDEYKIGNRTSHGKPNIEYYNKVCYLKNGTLLLASHSGEICFYDLHTQTTTQLYKPNQDNPENRCHSIAGNGSHIAYAIPGNPYIDDFDVAAKKWRQLPICYGDLEDRFEHIQYNADGTLLLTCERSARETKIWDVSSDEPKLLKTLYSLSSASFSPDSKYILLRIKNEDLEGEILLYSVKTGVLILRFLQEEVGYFFQFSPTNKHFVMWSPRKHPYLFEIKHLYENFGSNSEKPLLLKQYLFIHYIDALGEYGLTLDIQGIRPLEKYRDRIVVIYSPISKDDIEELKEVFKSFENWIQKYLILKYSL